jgi:galactose mutarotase-like enzyme
MAELRSAAGRLEATFVPGAGMLGWSLRHDAEELIGHPVSLKAYVKTGEPTGVALLHPWANRLAAPEHEIAGRRVRLDLAAPNVHTDEHGMPIHGLVAGSPRWEVLEETAVRLAARLDFAAAPELRAGFPFAHTLELVAALADDALAIETTLRPTGEEPVPVAFGFHPYLRLPGLDRRDWIVELPVTRRMVLDDRMLPTGRASLSGSRRLHWATGRSTTLSTGWPGRPSSPCVAAGGEWPCASARATASLRSTRRPGPGSSRSSR